LLHSALHYNCSYEEFLSFDSFQQKYDQLRKADPNAKKLTTVQKQAKYLEATNFVMAPVVQSVRPLHPGKVWEDISPQFLVTFWSLSMYDLQVPSDMYQKEVAKIKQLSLSVMDSKEMVSKSVNSSFVLDFHVLYGFSRTPPRAKRNRNATWP
jgi:Transcription factor/nuclear export subunit protein 2